MLQIYWISWIFEFKVYSFHQVLGFLFNIFKIFSCLFLFLELQFYVCFPMVLSHTSLISCLLFGLFLPLYVYFVVFILFYVQIHWHFLLQYLAVNHSSVFLYQILYFYSLELPFGYFSYFSSLLYHVYLYLYLMEHMGSIYNRQILNRNYSK